MWSVPYALLVIIDCLRGVTYAVYLENSAGMYGRLSFGIKVNHPNAKIYVQFPVEI